MRAAISGRGRRLFAEKPDTEGNFLASGKRKNYFYVKQNMHCIFCRLESRKEHFFGGRGWGSSRAAIRFPDFQTREN